MGKVVAGMASSHAYALVNPTGWEAMRQRTKANYKRRYGVEPPLDPKIAEETLEGNQERYSRVSAGFDPKGIVLPEVRWKEGSDYIELDRTPDMAPVYKIVNQALAQSKRK